MWPFKKSIDEEHVGTITQPVHQCNFTPEQVIKPEISMDSEKVHQAMIDELMQRLNDEGDKWSDKEKNWVTRECAARFLRAVKWQSVDAAYSRLVYTLDWRNQVKPDEIDPKEIEIEAKTGKILLNGFDKWGRPVIYLRPRFENTKPSPRQLALLSYTLEKAIKIMPDTVETCVIIIDMHGSSWSNTPGLQQTKNTITILERHYCERLGWGGFVRPIGILPVFWKMVQPFIDPVTKAKVFFASGTNDATNQGGSWVNLKDRIPEQVLPVEYGGTFDYQFDFETYWNSLTSL